VKIAIFAVGHTARGDDAVGHALLARVRDLESPTVHMRGLADGAALLDQGDHFDAWVIVDAFLGEQPGTVVTTTPEALASDALRPASTHTLPVPDAIAIARTLGTCAPVVRIVGVIGSDFTLGAPLSEAVVHALPAAERALRDVVEGLFCSAPHEEHRHA
jgi:hydrogenase maturation protease